MLKEQPIERQGEQLRHSLPIQASQKQLHYVDYEQTRKPAKYYVENYKTTHRTKLHR